MGSPHRDGEGRGSGRREAVAEVEVEAPALELIDEYWFFSNSLGKNGKGARPPPLPRSPLTSTSTSGKCRYDGDGGTQAGGTPPWLYESGCRRLVWTPSLPSRRVGMELSKDEEIVEAGGDQRPAAEVEDDDLNWSAIYEGVLRTRIAEGGRGGAGGRLSALHRAPSMPVPSSATADGGGEETPASKSTPSMARLRHSHSTLARHYRSHTPAKADRTARTSGCGASAPRRELRSFSASQQPATAAAIGRDRQSAFQDKKWKSSSDLESIEVQGFKDLGFVFDQEELRESLADVLPGLRGKPRTPSASHSGSDNDDSGAATSPGDDVRRPYLSEAWHHAPSRPSPAAAIRLRQGQAEARSAAEMKDQIRMWAQAVACNVRQEC